jgi:LytS/YehU family sensor histidine kinase
MLPLIENCFKHGASTMLEQPWISLYILLRGKQMHMKLLNGKTNEEIVDKEAAGIGIQNVQKRLDLLYAGKYDLNITNEEDVFIVNLRLELEQIHTKKTKSIQFTPERQHV